MCVYTYTLYTLSNSHFYALARYFEYSVLAWRDGRSLCLFKPDNHTGKITLQVITFSIFSLFNKSFIHHLISHNASCKQTILVIYCCITFVKVWGTVIIVCIYAYHSFFAEEWNLGGRIVTLACTSFLPLCFMFRYETLKSSQGVVFPSFWLVGEIMHGEYGCCNSSWNVILRALKSTWNLQTDI